MYKAIGFDWGGVLHGPLGTYLGQNIAKILGISHDEFRVAYFHHNKKINRGDITWEQLWYEVVAELGKIDKLQDVIDFDAEWSRTKTLNQDAVNLVDRIRSQGYKTGLLSNNTLEGARMIRDLDIEQHFDVFHISAETGLVKPDPATFRHFANELEVEFNELIFIDDAKKSLSTAEECGYTPILFESYQQLIKELDKLGIKT